MIKYTAAVVLIAASFLVSGCDDFSGPTSTPTPTPVPLDPVKELKAHLSRANPYSDLIWTNPEYDVRKTDSLAKPVVGFIEVQCQKKDGEKDANGYPKWIIMYEVELSFQNGEWVIDRLQGSNGWGMHEVTAKEESENHWGEIFKTRFGF